MRPVKIFSMLLASAVLAVTLSACGQSAGKVYEDLQVTDPLTECDSLDEMNLLAGTDIQPPANIDVADEVFRVIDTGDSFIAEYEFKSGDFTFWIRSANGYDDDISGLYIKGKTAFSGKASSDVQYASDEFFKLARWQKGDDQYVVLVEDEGQLTQDEFKDIVAFN